MRMLPFAIWIALTALALAIIPRAADAPKQLIAHRGASGYAPEHTAAAYKLAIEQKADFIEPDLAVTKDNVLICLHDDTLERTTNVAEVFPDRASAATAATESTRRPGKHWLANDFTLAEIKRLDAGKWFNPKFAGEKILTFEEMIALVRGHGGIYPELKSPPLYTSRGVDMEKIFVSVVKKLGLDTPASLKTMPVIIQSFDEADHSPCRGRPAGHPPRLPDVAGRRRHRRAAQGAVEVFERHGAGKGRHRASSRNGEGRARARHDGDVVDVQERRRQDGVPDRSRGDAALPLHVRHRRALHQQPGSVPETVESTTRAGLRVTSSPHNPTYIMGRPFTCDVPAALSCSV